MRPSGPTPTGKRVNDILDAYMSTLRHDRDMKPLNLVVITDGEASDNQLLVRDARPSAAMKFTLLTCMQQTSRGLHHACNYAVATVLLEQLCTIPCLTVDTLSRLSSALCACQAYPPSD